MFQRDTNYIKLALMSITYFCANPTQKDIRKVVRFVWIKASSLKF